MTKLSDTQALILSAAAQRPNNLAIPLPDSLKGSAAAKVVDAMLKRGLLSRVPANGMPAHGAKAEDGSWTTLVATPAGLYAIGVDTAAGEAPVEPAASKGVRKGPKPKSKIPTTLVAALEPKAAKPRKVADPSQPRTARPGSKEARLVDLLKTPSGASAAEIGAELGWQNHTIRAAIGTVVRKKLGLEVTTEKVEGRGTVYRVA